MPEGCENAPVRNRAIILLASSCLLLAACGDSPEPAAPPTTLAYVTPTTGGPATDEVMDGVTIDVETIRVERGLVRGIASDEDVCLLHNEIASKEQEALHTCRELVEQMNLQMTVVDCEFQFDRKKISFYFESERPVDFRDLNMELYRIFGVRIWLENQNQQVKHVTNDDRPARGGAGRGGASFRGRR